MAFFPLEDRSRLQDGYQKAFSVDELQLLLVQVEGEVYLVENRCPHMDIPLATGTLLPQGAIRCRAHGIEFNLASGKADGPLAKQLDCLKRFQLVYQGDQVGFDH